MRRVALVLLFLVCHVAARAVPAPYQRAGQAARSASAPYQREGRAPARPPLRQGLGACDEIIFATRTLSTDPHWYANISYFCKSTNAPAYSTEGRLLAYNLKTGKFRALLVNPSGSVRDPAVHYDGKTILFSYRPGGTGSYHLYTINADGTNLRQLTFGEYDDFEPTWLPDGDIVFVSTRCRRWVNCWMTQVATLYRMKPDGSGIRMISANTCAGSTWTAAR